MRQRLTGRSSCRCNWPGASSRSPRSSWAPTPRGVGITDENGDIIFSERFACINCGISYPGSPRACSRSTTPPAPVRPATASAPRCSLIRSSSSATPTSPCARSDRAVGEAQRAVLPADLGGGVALHFKFDMSTPWAELPQETRDLVLYGSKGVEVEFWFERTAAAHLHKKSSKGHHANLERRLSEVRAPPPRGRHRPGWLRQLEAAYEEFSPYMNKSPCEE